jgi:hypothetical protein
LGSLPAAAAEKEVEDGEEEDVPLLVFVSVVLLVLDSANVSLVVPGLVPVPVPVSLLSLVELLLVFVSVPVLASKLVSPLVFDLVLEVDEAFEAPASEELPVPVEDLEPDILAVLLSASAGDFTPELLVGSLVGFDPSLKAWALVSAFHRHSWSSMAYVYLKRHSCSS